MVKLAALILDDGSEVCRAGVTGGDAPHTVSTLDTPTMCMAIPAILLLHACGHPAFVVEHFQQWRLTHDAHLCSIPCQDPDRASLLVHHDGTRNCGRLRGEVLLCGVGLLTGDAYSHLFFLTEAML